MSAGAISNYVMGHTDRERRRLSLQAAVLNPITEDFLRRAGKRAPLQPLNQGRPVVRSVCDTADGYAAVGQKSGDGSAETEPSLICC